MAECIVLKGGNGADLDVVTAGVGDVLAGKVIVGTDGEPLTGTMANNGTVSQTLNAGGSYTNPTGYHNGSGKVTANSLSSQTSGTSTAAQILSGYTAWVAGSKITGSIASLAGQTITPSASQQTVSSSGKYMTGNVVVNAVSNLSAGNIKKGVVVGGVTGTFEGYVPTATDIYLRGTISSEAGGLRVSTGNVVLDSGQVTVLKSIADSQSPSGYYYGPCTYNKINLSGYNYVNVEFTVESTSANVNVDMALVSSSQAYIVPSSYLTYSRANVGVVNNRVISLSVSAWQLQAYVFVGVAYDHNTTHRVVIYRIWLS